MNQISLLNDYGAGYDDLSVPDKRAGDVIRIWPKTACSMAVLNWQLKI